MAETWLLALVPVGLVAGVVNTLAGGGSLVSLPALLLFGLPADLANGTNRVAVFLQSAASARGFDRAGRLDRGAIWSVAAPTLLGALAGALLAARLPAPLLRDVLVGAMILVAVVLLWKPGVLAPPPGTPVRRVREAPAAAPGLFLIGLYGGFVQAGVGIFLLTVLAGVLRYDLVRANALKVIVVAAFTGLSLVVFIVEGQVRWAPGLALAAGNVLGAQIGVRLALVRGQELLRRIILVMAIATCVAAWLRG